MPSSSPRFHHLDPALQVLQDDARAIWGDAHVRYDALAAIVTAWERDDGIALREALIWVDDAVVAGLRVLGLPRGPVRRLRFEITGRGWRGRKLPDCDLVFDAGAVQQAIRRLRLPDDGFRTWVHESIHARQLLAPRYQAESRLALGYEEGLAEGLARLVAHHRAGMAIREQSYNLYVAAYETLAEALGVSAERLWRELWNSAPGEVRYAFLGVVEQARGHLTTRQRQSLRGRADVVFSTPRAGEQVVDREALAQAWQRTLT